MEPWLQVSEQFCRELLSAPAEAWIRFASADGVRRRIVEARVLASRALGPNAAVVVLRVRARAVSWLSWLTIIGGEILLDVREVTLHKLVERRHNAWELTDGTPHDESDRERIDLLSWRDSRLRL